MKNFVYHDAVDGLRTAYEGSKDALDCLMSIPDMTAQAAREHHAAMLSGMAFAKDDFERYVSGQIGKVEIVRSAGEHMGFSGEMDAAAFYAAGRLPVGREEFAAAALMLRRKQGEVQPDHLAAAFYAVCIDHASNKDTLRAAQAAGYCIALQCAAVDCAAQTSLSVTGLDEYLRENEEHITAVVFVSTTILSELIACGVAVWLSLNGIADALREVGDAATAQVIEQRDPSGYVCGPIFLSGDHGEPVGIIEMLARGMTAERLDQLMETNFEDAHRATLANVYTDIVPAAQRIEGYEEIITELMGR